MLQQASKRPHVNDFRFNHNLARISDLKTESVAGGHTEMLPNPWVS
jgi:hypothetical protein